MMIVIMMASTHSATHLFALLSELAKAAFGGQQKLPALDLPALAQLPVEVAPVLGRVLLAEELGAAMEQQHVVAVIDQMAC